MKGVGVVENLELLYSLTADDGKSEKDLQNTIKKLKLILEKNDIDRISEVLKIIKKHTKSKKNKDYLEDISRYLY